MNTIFLPFLAFLMEDWQQHFRIQKGDGEYQEVYHF